MWDRVSDPVRPSKARQGFDIAQSSQNRDRRRPRARSAPADSSGGRQSNANYDGRKYKFFENERAVLVCGGIGPEAARRATEAIINLYAPVLVQSVGFAGALDSTLKVGTVLAPVCVIDAKDGSRVEAAVGHWVLVSVDQPVSVQQKAKLAEAYWAHAVDMEAAAVARGAQAHDITFVGLKVISDEADFEMPPLEPFVTRDGQFRTRPLPRSWPSAPGFGCECFGSHRNSNKAAATLFADGWSSTTRARRCGRIQNRACIPAREGPNLRLSRIVSLWLSRDNS